MSSLFSYVSKDPNEIRHSKDLSHGFFVDTSGSTCHYSNSKGKQYIEVELNIVRIFGKNSIQNKIVGWSNNATVSMNGQFKVERGGTDPSSIFRNSESAKIFNESEVIVFLTDGEIAQNNVTSFAKNCNGKLHKTLILCGLISKNKGTHSNISVFAPLLDAPNIVCFQYDGENDDIATILTSKGSISTLMHVGKTIHLEELCDIFITDAYAKIPKKNLVCNETSDEIMSIDLQGFINYVNSNAFSWDEIGSHIEKVNWSLILRNAKVTGTTDVIRNIINKLKHSQSEYVKSFVKNNHDMPFCEQRDALVVRVVEMKNNNEDYFHLKDELNELINKARLEEHEFSVHMKQRMTNATKIWDGIKNELFELEKGSYSLNDFVFSSNRANRAKQTNLEEITELESVLSHDNVPEIECCIHLDKGPAVLWLRSPEDNEISTTDHCLNFPLDSYPSLQKSIVVNPICGDCARGYIIATKNKYNNILKTVYNVPINGYIPLNFSHNNKFINHTLCNILCEGKILTHVKSLLLSIVDDNNEEWFMPIKNYIINELINRIYTTDTFTEDGTKMKMIDALKKLNTNEQALLSQPLTAAYRLLKMHYLYGNGDRENICTMAKRRMSYFLVEHRSFSIKPKGNREEELALYNNYNDELNKLLFSTLCGIPLEHTAKLVFVEDISNMLGINWNNTYNSICELSKAINADPMVLINKEFLTYIIYGISSFPNYDKPMHVFTKLLKNEFFLNAEHQKSPLVVKTNINKDKFSRYHDTNITDSPCYEFYNGIHSTPSKLFFNKEPLWNNDMNGKTFAIDALANKLGGTLRKKIMESYGSVVPDNSSAHTNLHRNVAMILEKYFPNENDTNNPDIVDSMGLMCFEKLKQTQGEKGNIYARMLYRAYIYAIYDFCDLRKKYKPDNFKEHCTDMYNVTKLRLELIKNKMDVNDFEQVAFDINNLTPPMFMREKYPDLDVNAILKRINTKYSLQHNDDVDSLQLSSMSLNNVIKVNPDDIITINANNIDFSLWDKEQIEVVSKVSLKDSTDFSQIKYYAGADISFHKDDNSKAVACFVIFDNKTDGVVGEVTIKCQTNIPYKAGYLAFREAPILLKLLDIVKKECMEIMPELLIFDGNGIWHPRGCGIATHFSVLTGIPAFGVAKSILVLPGVTRDGLYERISNEANEKNSMIDVSDVNGKVVGAAYNTTGTVKSSIFLSVGSGISLDTVKDITRRVTIHAVTEPVRRADLLSREILATI